jgi:hypothetical protein
MRCASSTTLSEWSPVESSRSPSAPASTSTVAGSSVSSDLGSPRPNRGVITRDLQGAAETSC